MARHQGSLRPRLRALHNDPQGLLAKVTEEIEAYWELVLAPYWARIRAVLDADVLYRARMAAEHGAGHLLNDLHTSVSWDDNALRMSRRKQPLTRTSAGTGLLLIPSAFTVPGRSRTLLLTELEIPASTTQLAHRTGLSPAGVSQYLTALRKAGLVSAHRAGRSVLYARTTAAETLLQAASA
ncbi:ArsR/SmtB family transcription factor [Streptomyces subrutilus]|uniref:ArsR/SmtB family transcription factor n=1 Tax=Streptomyces subrutilus TaxID=36818 RepID=UPI0032676C29